MSRLIEQYIRELFDEKDVSEETSEKLRKHYYDKLAKGIDEGFNPESLFYDEELSSSLKLNISEFSAFKETSFKQALQDLLTKDGKLLPWSEFKKEAYKVSDDYNVRWLEAEYHQTVATAQMAGKMKDYESNLDLYPNLKLVSVKDGRVRPEHKILDGTIRPYNDPFWSTHTPPLDWGCRCDIEQTDEETTEIKGGLQLKLEFQNNPAQSGKIFPETAYSKDLSKKEKETIIKDNIDRVSAQRDKDAKGIVTTSPNFQKQDFKRNFEIANICAKQTQFDFHIREHVEKQNFPNPEYLINKMFFGDRKSVENVSKGILNGIDGSKAQMLNKNINPQQLPYYIVWDFDLIKDLDINTLVRNLQRKITPERGKNIRGMFFQYKGKAVHLSREQMIEREFLDLHKLIK
ncbi:phage head morphogenesis protein [Chryseobacterium daeguense]|uniref:phage head morphogenesis protein n=1 Tax=Chryseobacterium daeguense TaxID=412438 RepID=UPI000410C310|nr:phage head morphogenesis protein [Chryseobacterium daeguense]